jgi:MFS family permease
MENTASLTATNRKMTAAAIGAAAMLYWAGLYFYVPTLPVYVQGRVGNLVVTGTILSMYGLWQAVSRLLVGMGADWLGRRKPLLILSLSLVLVGAWLLSRMESALGLGFARALTGLGAGAWVLLVVMFSASFEPAQVIRATGILTLVTTFSRMVATSMNGWLNQLGGYALAFQVAVAAVGLAILLTLLTPEKPQPVQSPSFRKLLSLASRRDVLLPALLNTLLQYCVWTGIFSFAPILARRLGADDMLLSALTSLYLLAMVLGNLIVSFIGSRLAATTILRAGFILLVSGLGLAALAPAVTVLVISQLICGLAEGILYPTALGASIRYVSEEERASAMGLHQSIYALGMFGGPWLSGILASLVGIQPMFALTAALALGLALLGVRALKGEYSGRG